MNVSSWARPGRAVRTVGTVLGTALIASVTVAALPAAATESPGDDGLRVVRTLSSAFVGPLQFAVAGGKIFVADAFTSTLTQVGSATPIATGGNPMTGGDLAGVAVNRWEGSLAYTTTNDESHSKTSLTILRKGHKPVVADLSGYEKKRNPDKVNHYGVKNSSKCVTDALTAAHFPVSYTGQVDSHPYAVAALGHGSWAVADAGGNDIVKVDRWGRVSTIAVLPSQPVKMTAAMAAAQHLPSCVVGITYRFEPVPTDVETGPDGNLYVTTLPGGPEGPNSGNPGSVYKIDRWGHTHRVATGFHSATNLAIDAHGRIFVAELGSGTISQVVHGKPKVVLSLPGVVAVEYASGRLYASTAPALIGASGPGTIVLLGSAEHGES